MPSLRVYILYVFVFKVIMHCYFHMTAQLHLRKQGSLKVKHSALNISNFGLIDSFISFYFLFHISTLERKYGISILYTTTYTWTKQLTIGYSLAQQFV